MILFGLVGVIKYGFKIFRRNKESKKSSEEYSKTRWTQVSIVAHLVYLYFSGLMRVSQFVLIMANQLLSELWWRRVPTMEENSLLVLFQNRSNVDFLNGLKVSDRPKKKKHRERNLHILQCCVYYFWWHLFVIKEERTKKKNWKQFWIVNLVVLYSV